MGRTYVFECSRCGYRAKVAGGADSGLRFSVQTIACRDCKALYDAVTRLRVTNDSLLASWRISATGKRSKSAAKAPTSSDAPPTFQSAVNLLPLKETTQARWVTFKPRCPAAKDHRVQAWNAPGKCPQCGIYLEQNVLPFRLWD